MVKSAVLKSETAGLCQKGHLNVKHLQNFSFVCSPWPPMKEARIAVIVLDFALKFSFILLRYFFFNSIILNLFLSKNGSFPHIIFFYGLQGAFLEIG